MIDSAVSCHIDSQEYQENFGENIVPYPRSNSSQVGIKNVTFNRESIMLIQLESVKYKMLPPQAEKKMRCWIRSRHLICSGNFFIFETLEYTTIERFSECVASLGGTVISVEPINKIWMGDHRQVILYQAKASLHTPHHTLKQYWIKHGALSTKFDERA